MKDIVKLVKPQEIHAFVYNLLETEVLRKSYDEGGLVYDIIDRFARLPRFFYKPTDLDVEAPHFSPWWGGVMLREYDNKVIQDLYYLHEIEHAGTMPYGPDINHPLTDPTTFKNKIRDNEHEASVLSEMTIYCEFPELRALSFPHAVFVDRFLFPDGDFSHVDVRMQQRWREEPDLVTKEMMYARAAILTSKDTYENDMPAFWLKRFYSQGLEWTKIWTNPKGELAQFPKGGRFAEIEKGMVAFRENCARLGRKEALDRHVDWLLSPDIAEGTNIPFYREAKAFSEVYQAHKEKYFDAIKRIGQQPVNYNRIAPETPAAPVSGVAPGGPPAPS